jgi:hypothetical protein
MLCFLVATWQAGQVLEACGDTQAARQTAGHCNLAKGLTHSSQPTTWSDTWQG